MPLFIGLSTHNDTKHKTTAKRDVVGGVVAMDGTGNMYAVGPKIYLTRDGANKIYAYERTSGEKVMSCTRLGANDYI